MPAYAPKEKGKLLHFELPSTAGAEVWGPSRVGFKAKKEIASKALRAQFEGMDDEGQPLFIPIFDPHLMQYEMVVQFLTHKDAGCNLFTPDGTAIRLTRSAIDTGEIDEDDLEALAVFLQEQLGDQLSDDTSAEGEPESPNEKPSSDDLPTEMRSRSAKTGSSKK